MQTFCRWVSYLKREFSYLLLWKTIFHSHIENMILQRSTKGEKIIKVDYPADLLQKSTYIHVKENKGGGWPKGNVIELKHIYQQQCTDLWLGGVTAADELDFKVCIFLPCHNDYSAFSPWCVYRNIRRFSETLRDFSYHPAALSFDRTKTRAEYPDLECYICIDQPLETYITQTKRGSDTSVWQKILHQMKFANTSRKHHIICSLWLSVWPVIFISTILEDRRKLSSSSLKSWCGFPIYNLTSTFRKLDPSKYLQSQFTNQEPRESTQQDNLWSETAKWF